MRLNHESLTINHVGHNFQIYLLVLNVSRSVDHNNNRHSNLVTCSCHCVIVCFSFVVKQCFDWCFHVFWFTVKFGWIWHKSVFNRLDLFLLAPCQSWNVRTIICSIDPSSITFMANRALSMPTLYNAASTTTTKKSLWHSIDAWCRPEHRPSQWSQWVTSCPSAMLVFD